MISYLNTEYHNDFMSCGRRHLASVALNGIFNYVGYDFMYKQHDYKELRECKGSPIVKLITDLFNNQPKTLGLFKPRKMKLGNYIVDCKYEKGRLYISKDKNDIHPMQLKNDIWFMNWFVWNYEFDGLGELTKPIHDLMYSMMQAIESEVVSKFHYKIQPTTNKYAPYPEVVCRNMTTAFYSAVTIKNAIEIGSYDKLKKCSYMDLTDMVHGLEDIANSKNNTDYSTSKLYYNQKTKERSKQNAYEMARIMLGLS